MDGRAHGEVDMKVSQSLVVALVSGSVALGACKDNPPTPPPAPSASAAPLAASIAAPSASASAVAADTSDAGAPSADKAQKHGHGLRGGPAGMFFRATKDLELDADQKAKVDKLREQLQGDDEIKKDVQEMHADLIAGVKEGKLDAAKMDAHFATAAKEMQTRHEKQASALNDLHAALKEPQRKALVASIKAKMAEHGGIGGHGGRGHGGHGKKEGDVKKPDNAKRIERLTKSLELDAEQTKKVTDMLAKAPKPGDARADYKKKLDALFAAFEKPTFDAKTLDAFKVDPTKAVGPMKKHVEFLGKLLPILKPEQRTKLAEGLDKSKDHRGRQPSEEADDDIGWVLERLGHTEAPADAPAK
jgi:Spy/CpxP family protein refolding chaperone